MKTQIKRALVFTKKTSTLVTKGRALLQIEKKGRASLGQGLARTLLFYKLRILVAITDVPLS